MKNIAFYFDPKNCPMGDMISVTSIPENFYKTHNEKLIDIFNLWVFDYNPYVIRNITHTFTLNFSEELSKNGIIKNDLVNNPYGFSLSQVYCNTFGLKMSLRHPRLYRFEDNVPDGNCIAIHTHPRGLDPTRQGHIPENILKHICEIYKTYQIYQVGGKEDFKINAENVIDKTGLSFWDTAEIISKCGIFIATNSGHIQLANCYPRVKKKLILFNHNYLYKLIPQCHLAGVYGNWIDFNWEYYNNTEEDIGISMSYLKI